MSDTARPAETVSETTPARHEAPDVAELRRLAEAANADAVQGATYERDWPLSSRAVGRFLRALNPDLAIELLDAAAERDALAADADKWQRAALTLQRDRDALTDELAHMRKARAARAWDEGYVASATDDVSGVITPNPYRQTEGNRA